MKASKKSVLLLIVVAFAFCTMTAACGDPGDKAEAIRYETMMELMEDRYENISVVSISDSAQFQYLELKEEAHTIALVTATDELSKDNSTLMSRDVGGQAPGYWIWSMREVETVESYKNTRKYESTFDVAERCIMTEDRILARDGWYPMQKGEHYLLFLGDTNYEGNPPMAISCENGKIDLTNLRLNRRMDIALGAIAGLLAEDTTTKSDNTVVDMPEDMKNALTRMTPAGQDMEAKLDEDDTPWKEITVTTRYTAPGMEYVLKYIELDGAWFFRLSNGLYKSA